MTDLELALLALGILVVALICLQIRSQRKKGKTWREIGEEYAEHLDPTGLFRGRKGRKRDDDDDSDSSPGSDGPDADVGD